MAFDLKFSMALKNAQQNAITTTLSTSAVMSLYPAPKPAGPDAAAGVTALVALPCSVTLAGAAASGILTLNAITAANASATGTAAWYRISTSGGTAHIDGTAGMGTNFDLNMINTSLTSGQPVSINNFATFTNAN